MINALNSFLLQIESVFDDRRSIDTTLIDKPLYEEEISVYGGVPTNTISSHGRSLSGGGSSSAKTSRQNSDYNKNSEETLTKHFIKQTTIIPRTKSVIQC